MPQYYDSEDVQETPAPPLYVWAVVLIGLLALAFILSAPASDQGGRGDDQRISNNRELSPNARTAYSSYARAIDEVLKVYETGVAKLESGEITSADAALKWIDDNYERGLQQAITPFNELEANAIQKSHDDGTSFKDGLLPLWKDAVKGLKQLQQDVER